MAVSSFKFVNSGEQLFRKYPFLSSDYVWVLLESTYSPSGAHDLFADISAHVCGDSQYLHVDASGKVFTSGGDPDCANVLFAAGCSGKYIALLTKSGGAPDKLVGFYDANVGQNENLVFNVALNINAGGLADYQIEGWTYGAPPPPVDPNDPPPSGVVTETVITQFSRAATPTSYPLNFCVPYAKGVLASNSTFALYDQSNVKKRAQFDAFERWEDTSIKMLHVCTDTSFNAQKTFTVKSGDSQNFANACTVVTAGGNTTVSFNGNNYVTNNSNFSFLNGYEIFADDAFTNLTYESTGAATTTVVENGEVRCVLKSTGSLTNGGTTLIKYILRQYFYPLSSCVEVELTVVDDRAEPDQMHLNSVSQSGGPLKLSIKEYGFKKAGTYNRLFAAGETVNHDQTSTSDLLLKQNGNKRWTNANFWEGHTFSYSGIGTAAKAKGAFRTYKTSGEQNAFCFKNFWREYPNQVQVGQTGEKISFHFIEGGASTTYPTLSTEYLRPNTFYSPIKGMQKTTNLLFVLSSVSDAELISINEIFNLYAPLALPSFDYMRSTKVFGDYKLSNSNTTTYDNRKNNNINAAFFNGIDGGAPLKASVQYGWRDFGDRARPGWANTINTVRIPSFYNGTHCGGDRFFLQFLRGGNEKYYYISEIETHHGTDIDVAHCARKGYFTIRSTNTPIDLPAGELHALGHDVIDHASRNIHMGHMHSFAACSFYLLQKNYRYKECLDQQKNWLTTFWQNFPPLGTYPLVHIPNPENRWYQDAERDTGWMLYSACKFAHYTNDPAYYDSTIQKIIDLLIIWIKCTKDHYINSAIVGTHDFSQGTGYWWLDHVANVPSHITSTGCNPWQAGSIFAGLAYARDLSIRFNKTLPADFLEMVRQAMAYVVQWGRNANGQWLYYEGGTSVDRADHLAYGLGYWGNHFQNTSWYNLGAAIHASTLALTFQDSNGYYGYEEVEFPEQFKIFNT